MIKTETVCDLCGGKVTSNHVEESIPIWKYGYSGKYCKVVAHVSLNQDHVCQLCSEHIIRSVGLNSERNIKNAMHDLDGNPQGIAVRDSNPNYGITVSDGYIKGWFRETRNDKSHQLWGQWQPSHDTKADLSWHDLVACDWGTYPFDPEEDPIG